MAERRRGVGVLRRAAALARGRATPFYAFDRAEALRNTRAWAALAAEDPPLRAFYPWKCNRHPPLLEAAAAAGLGAEVTVSRDLEAALATLGGGRVVLQGPSPSAAQLDRALGAGALVVADAPADAEAIGARARALGVAPRWLLRLRPASVGAEQAPFGMTAREIAAVVRGARGPAPEGLAFHLGTRIGAAAPFLSALREAAALAHELGRFGLAIRTLDVGGGFPARLESAGGGSGRADPLEIAAALRREAARRLPGVTLLAEPGRAIASDAFHLVARVQGVRGRTVRLDASRMSHAFFVPRGRHPFLAAPVREPRTPASEVTGCLPVGLDVLSASERIGRPRVGDVVVVGAVGAYNLIAANEWAGTLPEVVELGPPTY